MASSSAFYEAIWERHYAELVAFQERHGHTRVTENNQTARGLAGWREDQCTQFRRGTLRADRRARLEALGFELDPGKRIKEEQQKAWDARFAELQAFREVHGHCRVPERLNKVLSGWVDYLREARRANRLEVAKCERLDEIGFEWKPSVQIAGRWEQRLNELAAFQQQHGHFDVVPSTEPTPGLADWRDRQRAMLREGRMPKERRQKLEALGFEWDSPRDRAGGMTPHQKEAPNLPKDAISRWELFYNRLVAFQAEHGHLRVPANSTEHRQLASWVREQHEGLEYGRLHLDQIDRLKALGLF